MAKKVEVTRVDDTDGSEADENVAFGLDGRYYEIDLTAAHAQQMRDELAPYVGAARRVRNGPPGRKKQPSRSDLPEIREYARARGYDINERGRIPERIIAEYDTLKTIGATS